MRERPHTVAERNKMSEEVKEEEKTEATAEAAKPAKEKKSFLSENAIEIITVILLGVTALLTAWASYAGSIHGGNQATNYAKSNNIASDGNSRYNEAVQRMAQDQEIWNQISEYEVAILYADSIGDEDAIEENVWKLQWLCADNLTEEMGSVIGYDYYGFFDGENDQEEILAWLHDESGQAVTSPFINEDFVNAYFEDSYNVLAESEEVLAQGQEDNANGDKFSLVSVIYSVVLFLLGIVGVFKNKTNKVVVLTISIVCLLIAFIYMLTIPLPTSGGIFG